MRDNEEDEDGGVEARLYELGYLGFMGWTELGRDTVGGETNH